MSEPRKAISILDTPDHIRLLADFMRTEILHLLGKSPMTETQLSEQLGLTKAAVGYHLHMLLDAGLIKIDRVEPEKHGILQKFYSPTAVLFIVDPDHIPPDVQRYFVRAQEERLMGMFSAHQLHNHVTKVSLTKLEKLATAMLEQLKVVGQKHEKDMTIEDAESLDIKIYAEALANLARQKEWRGL